MNIRDEQVQARHKAHQDDAFSRWLSEPMTRFGLSMIPAGEHQDALRLMLRSAFDAGAGAGMGGMMMTIIDAISKKKEP